VKVTLCQRRRPLSLLNFNHWWFRFRTYFHIWHHTSGT